MSVIVSGMEMPEHCGYCRFRYDGICHALQKTQYSMEECPLVPLRPYGRLIDADALMNEFEKAQRTMQQHGREYSCSFMSSSQEISTEWYCVEDILDNAPTIIPAEEET